MNTLVIYEEGAIEAGSLDEQYDAVVLKLGSPRPTIYPSRSLMFAEEGSVVSAPDYLTVVELRRGASAPTLAEPFARIA